MALQTQGNGQTYWPISELMQQVAVDVVRGATLTERILNIVEQLSDRVQQLEQQTPIEYPQPQDFGIQDSYGPLRMDDEEDPDEPEEDEQDLHEAAVPREVRPGQLLALLKPSEFTDAMAKLVRFLPPKWTHKYLECVLIERDGGKLRLTAGDGKLSLSFQLDGLCQGELSMLVPAKQLHQASKSFAGDELQVVLDGSKLILTDGKARCEVEALDPDSYPEQEELEGGVTQLPSLPLLRAFRLALHCAVKDNGLGSSHYTNGVLLRVEQGKATVVATDGHRLVESTFNQAGQCDEPFELLIPARCIAEVVKLLPENQHHLVTIEANRDEMQFTTPRWQEGVRKLVKHPEYSVRVRLVDVAFPPAYRSVLSNEVRCRASFDRKDLLGLLTRAAGISDKLKPRVHFLVRLGSATVSAQGPNGSSMNSAVSIDQHGTDFGTELDPCYLLAFVKLLAGKSVDLCWTGEQGPVYLADPEEPGLRYAVMQILRD